MPDSTFCYVVLAHRPSGLPELVERIRELSPTAHVLVRYEDPDLIDPALIRAAGATPLVSRIHVCWGAWSLTEAMLEALGEARALTGAGHYVLISGQDYPVRNLPVWEREISDSGVDALLDPIVDHPLDWRFRWSFIEVDRPKHPQIYRALRHLGWRVGTMTRPVVQVLPRFADDDRRWLVGVARPWVRVPHDITVTKASQWMTLSRRAVETVLRIDRGDRALRRFFATVRISDESYIQSILNAAPTLTVARGETTVKRFGPDASSPDLLDADLLREIAGASTAPFARKIPLERDPALIAAADDLARADLSGRRKDHLV